MGGESRSAFWRSVREAVRGSSQDYTEISIHRAVFLLAIPMVLEMAMESLFAVVDVFWVTRLGPNAVAAVGLTESVLALVFAVAEGVSMAATAMVARRIGEKNTRGASVAAVQAIVLGTLVAVAMGVPGYCLAPQLLRVMGAPPDLVATGARYTALVLGGSLVVMLLFLNNAIFRGAGDAAIAMRVLWGANLLNMLLGPLLIFGWGPFPRMGVTGAAVATLIGRGSGVLYQFWMLTGRRGRVSIARADLRLAWPALRSLVRVSSTGALQFAMGNASWIALVRMISAFGSSAVAGYTIGIIPVPLVHLFTHDPPVVRVAVSCLRIVSLGNLTYAYGMVMVQAFNGAGDTATPTLINIFGFWMVEIPLAWTLAFAAAFGVNGVFAAIPVSEGLIAAAGLVLFRRGHWKRRKI